MLNYDQIKKVFCDISVSENCNFACWCIRCYDQNNNLLENATGLFEKEWFSTQKFSSNQCEIMVTILVMETMPKNWEGTIYTDCQCVFDVWEAKDKKNNKKVTSIIPSGIVRTRFHMAYNRVLASLTKLDGIHMYDFSGHSKGPMEKLWSDLKIEQAFHLECDRNCGDILRDYKKWSTFICLEDQ